MVGERREPGRGLRRERLRGRDGACRRRRARGSARPGRGSGTPARGPSRSARSTISVFACGMSRPDSMIVVATRQSASPRRNVEHRRLQLRPVHLAVRLGEAHAGAQRAQPLGDLVQRLDPVVEEEDLAVAADLALDRLRDQLLVVGADVGADRPPALGRRLDHRDVAQAGEAHLQRARDRRRRQREHVHPQLELAQQLLLLDAEALLLVDDQEAEVLGADVAREQAVGADQDVDRAVGERGQRRLHLGRLAQPRDHLDLEREVARGARGRCPRCCWARIVVGTSIITCLPSAAALTAARSATSVLP